MQIGKMYPFAAVAIARTGSIAREVNRPISRHFTKRNETLSHEKATHPESILNKAEAMAFTSINKMEYMIITKNLLKKYPILLTGTIQSCL